MTTYAVQLTSWTSLEAFQTRVQSLGNGGRDAFPSQNPFAGFDIKVDPDRHDVLRITPREPASERKLLQFLGEVSGLDNQRVKSYSIIESSARRGGYESGVRPQPASGPRLV